MTPARTIDLDQLTLASGSHRKPNSANEVLNEGACIMEAVAYVAGEPWSDHPACASKIIGAFLRSWNDTLADADRNRLLKPYVLRLVGTAGTTAQEDERAWMCLDWLVRTYTPAWLRAAGLNDQAALLTELGEFKSGMDVPSIRPTIDAARAAAWDAAWDAAGDAAWDAAWAVAGDAAGDAAWFAARAAARDAAGAAARAAARAVAGDAARDAAWDAALAAARAVAGAGLQPVVDELQPLALHLVDRMLSVQ